MQMLDIRTFIPSKDYETSKAFYQALGFSCSDASEDLSIFQNGSCTFFLQRYYNEEFANNLMLQLIVADIKEAFALISSLQGFDIRYRPIQQEHWGKVIYLWGPAGELWHVTQLNQ
jgi:hypothetical protein